jgi:hypothetical protein
VAYKKGEKMKAAAKAGKLANGLELGKGKIIHAVENTSYNSESICGTKPAIAWSERELTEINCPKCIKQMRRELTIKNLLNQIDNIEEDK